MAYLGLAKIAFLSLGRKRLRTALLILGIVIGVGLLTGMSAATDGLTKTFSDAVSDRLGKTDLIVRPNATNYFNFNLIENSLATSDVAGYAKRFQQWTLVSTRQNFSSPTYMYLVGINPQEDEQFGKYMIVNGSIPSMSEGVSSTDNWCIITESVADVLGVGVNDHIWFATWNMSKKGAQVAQRPQFSVKAVIRDYGKVYDFDPKDPTSFWPVYNSIFLHIGRMQSIFSTQNVTHVLVHVSDISKSQTVADALQSQLGSSFAVCNVKQQTLQSVEKALTVIKTVSTSMAGMAAVVAAMLILNVMFIAVSERKFEIGVLRAMGSSRLQIFRLFLLEVLFIGLIGAFGGVGFAILATKLILMVMESFVVKPNLALEFVFTPYHALFGFAVGVGFTLIAGLVPAISASRVRVVEALRPRMRVFRRRLIWSLASVFLGAFFVGSGVWLMDTGFKGLVSVSSLGYIVVIGFVLAAIGVLFVTSPLLGVFSRALTPLLGKLGVLVHRNILRNLRRSVFTYATLAFCVALLVTIGSTLGSLKNSSTLSVQYSAGSDIVVSTSAPWSFAGEIKSIAGVKSCSPNWIISNCNFTRNNALSNVKVRLIGVNSTEYFDTIYEIKLTKTLNGISSSEVFRKIVEQRGYIIIQDKLAENLTVNVGDTLTWTTTNNTRVKFTVVAVASLITGVWETVWVDWASKYGYFAAVVSVRDVSRFHASNADEFLVSVSEGADPKVVANDIRGLCRVKGYPINWIGVTAEQLELVKESYNQIYNYFMVTTIFSVMVSGLGVMAAMAYTVLERRREIGVLRAFGVSRRQILMVFVGEAFLLSLIGFAVGLATGLSLTYYMITSLPTSSLAPLSFTLPWETVGYALIACVLAAFVSSLYPAYKLSKLKVTEALRR